MTRVLIISKPFAPPWHDSSKNLARELVRAARDTHFRVLGAPGDASPWPNATVEPVYRHAGRFEPGLLQNLRVLARLLRPWRADLAHFFFAPNRRSAQAARLALRASLGRRRSVQTLCSLPAEGQALGPGLFADRVVVLSRYAQQRLAAEGFHDSVLIPPAVRRPPFVAAERRRCLQKTLGLDPDRPSLLFAGDLEAGRGADTFVAALPALLDALPEVQVIVAARVKTPASRALEQSLREQARRAGIAHKLRWLGEHRAMRSLLAAVDLQVLVARSLEKKMDFPLVILEGLALGTPALLSDREPLSEIFDAAPAEAGSLVAVDDPHALAEHMTKWLGDSDRLRRSRPAAYLAAERFTPERMARAYSEIYQSL